MSERTYTKLKILTVKQPWAGAILAGPKDIENRTQRTHFRGTLLIHASRSDDHDALRNAELVRRIGTGMALADQQGVILGMIDIKGCERIDDVQLEWASGPWCWLLDKATARIFREPIPHRGQLGLHDVPDALAADVAAAIADALTPHTWLRHRQDDAMHADMQREAESMTRRGKSFTEGE